MTTPDPANAGTEFGGMNEMMADLYADTGDKRWLDLSYSSSTRPCSIRSKRGEDPLRPARQHAGAEALGSAARYAYTGDASDSRPPLSSGTRRRPPHLRDRRPRQGRILRRARRSANITDGRTAETCNVYNMLKLTRQLFALQPDIRYAEFHERALFNHILGSIDPSDGATCYMVPVGRGVRREYADMQRSFTCCVGSGMESHALHGDGIYYERGMSSDGARLWVNIYAPSTAQWRAAGATSPWRRRSRKATRRRCG